MAAPKARPRGLSAREAVSSRPVSRDLLRRLRQIEIITNRLVDEQLAGQYHSVFKGRGMSFDEVRPYSPGDDIRHIEWNVSARAGQVFVKQFIEERELTVLLLVDASASLSFGTREQSKISDAAWLSALIGFSAIRNQDRVGLIAFTEQDDDTPDEESLLFVPPKKGRSHSLRIVRDVMAFEAWAEERIRARRAQPRSDSRTRLETALSFMNHVTKRRAVAFLISDFRAEGYEQALAITNQRHDVVPIVMSDPGERELMGGGITYCEDPETGAVFPIYVSGKARQRYALDAARFDARLQRQLARYGMATITLPPPTDDSRLESRAERYTKALVNYFRIRARRR